MYFFFHIVIFHVGGTTIDLFKVYVSLMSTLFYYYNIWFFIIKIILIFFYFFFFILYKILLKFENIHECYKDGYCNSFQEEESDKFEAAIFYSTMHSLFSFHYCKFDRVYGSK